MTGPRQPKTITVLLTIGTVQYQLSITTHCKQPVIFYYLTNTKKGSLMPTQDG